MVEPIVTSVQVVIIVLVKITTTVVVVETVRGSTPQLVVGPGPIVAITRKEVDVVGVVVVIVVGGSSIIVIGAVVVEVAVAVVVAVAVAVTIDTIFGITMTRYNHHCHKTKMVIMIKITDKKWLHINDNLDSEHRAMKTKGWK